MSNLSGDLRFALRSLRKSPGFTVTAVAVLALGIGANTAIFSVVNGVLLRPLPYPEPGELMQVETVFESGASGNVSNPDYEDLRTQNRSFVELAAYSNWTTSAVTAGRGSRIDLAAVSANFFTVLGVGPVRGRVFTANEEKRQKPVAVVSDGYWRNHLGGSTLEGQVVRIGGEGYDVVGVMPPSFDFPAAAQVWIPRRLQTTSRTAENWHVVGRLRHGVSPSMAQLDLSAIARHIKQRYGEDTYMSDALVRPVIDRLVGSVRPALWVLSAASGLLLLVACVNVVNLLLTRVIARDRELALRLALGARPIHLVRRFLAESLLLSLAGTGLGVLLAIAGVPALLALAPSSLPRAQNIGVDWTVLTFALAVCVLGAVAIGLIPAARAARGEARKALGGGRSGVSGSISGQRARGALVASQVALTILLLVGVGLLGRSFLKLLAVDPGYRTHGAMVMDLWLRPPRDEAGALRNHSFLARVVERLRTVPGVERVGGVNVFPLEGGNAPNGTFLILQRPDEVTDFKDFERLVHLPARTGHAEYRVASAGYFGAMGISLIRGRLFDDRDGPQTTNVALISASLARSRWPGEDPLGKLIQFGNMDGNLRPFTIVGVVGDVREESIGATPHPTFYADYRQRAVSEFHFAIQGGGEAGPLAVSAREAVHQLDPQVPLRIRTLTRVVASSLADRRFVLLLLSLFAGLALVLATTGVYGVIAYATSRRTPEIGIRIALGARRHDVVRLLVRQGAIYASAGIVAGLGGGLALSRLLRGFCYGVEPTDPLSFGFTAALTLTVALTASWIPAQRAARIDPMEALRHE